MTVGVELSFTDFVENCFADPVIDLLNRSIRQEIVDFHDPRILDVELAGCQNQIDIGDLFNLEVMNTDHLNRMNQTERAADFIAQHLVDAHPRRADQNRSDRIFIALQGRLNVKNDIAEFILTDLRVKVFLKQHGDQPGDAECLFVFGLNIIG